MDKKTPNNSSNIEEQMKKLRQNFSTLKQKREALQLKIDAIKSPKF
ncbi:MAG: hypothetical protein AAGI07_06495 [Bacteroidota bacterium]